jgi:L-alanine-DL-glutamate epimerase-like enolase superfamily enzyme
VARASRSWGGPRDWPAILSVKVETAYGHAVPPDRPGWGVIVNRDDIRHFEK